MYSLTHPVSCCPSHIWMALVRRLSSQSTNQSKLTIECAHLSVSLQSFEHRSTGYERYQCPEPVNIVSAKETGKRVNDTDTMAAAPHPAVNDQTVHVVNGNVTTAASNQR